MASLEAAKRDKIPKETILIWFEVLTENKFTNADLDLAVKQIMTRKCYGGVKIDDFFTENEDSQLEDNRVGTYDPLNSPGYLEFLSQQITKEAME